ncbi:hypothetical protein EYF80_067420 [Liparis tanakae]|uniref:Uncharacterized protein n=1 Tax=Liparis tanakae TaxID=230148 RepID=A0A4Z2E0W4_9TELE|nr:hypothetical protein EYF80_067420 [Liparis tanakae]
MTVPEDEAAKQAPLLPTDTGYVITVCTKLYNETRYRGSRKAGDSSESSNDSTAEEEEAEQVEEEDQPTVSIGQLCEDKPELINSLCFCLCFLNRNQEHDKKNGCDD